MSSSSDLRHLELTGGPRRLRASPVLISSLVSLSQEDTVRLPAGAGGGPGAGREESPARVGPGAPQGAGQRRPAAARARGRPRYVAPASHRSSGHRRAASCGAALAAWPASLPARDSRLRLPRRPRSSLADSGPALSQPASPRSLWEPASALGWPGRGRRAHTRPS